jgi:hypothetical protein
MFMHWRIGVQYSIRDLFLVTAIIAVCAAWAIDHSRQAAQYRALIKSSRYFVRRPGPSFSPHTIDSRGWMEAQPEPDIGGINQPRRDDKDVDK